MYHFLIQALYICITWTTINILPFPLIYSYIRRKSHDIIKKYIAMDTFMALYSRALNSLTIVESCFKLKLLLWSWGLAFFLCLTIDTLSLTFVMEKLSLVATTRFVVKCPLLATISILSSLTFNTLLLRPNPSDPLYWMQVSHCRSMLFTRIGINTLGTDTHQLPRQSNLYLYKPSTYGHSVWCKPGLTSYHYVSKNKALHKLNYCKSTTIVINIQ